MRTSKARWGVADECWKRSSPASTMACEWRRGLRRTDRRQRGDPGRHPPQILRRLVPLGVSGAGTGPCRRLGLSRVDLISLVAVWARLAPNWRGRSRMFARSIWNKEIVCSQDTGWRTDDVYEIGSRCACAASFIYQITLLIR